MAAKRRRCRFIVNQPCSESLLVRQPLSADHVEYLGLRSQLYMDSRINSEKQRDRFERSR